MRYIERERKSDSKRETESVGESDRVREINSKRVNNTHTHVYTERDTKTDIGNLN